MSGFSIHKKRTWNRRDGSSATTYHVKDTNGKHISTHVVGHEGSHSYQAHDPAYENKLKDIHAEVEQKHADSGLRNDYAQHLYKMENSMQKLFELEKKLKEARAMLEKAEEKKDKKHPDEKEDKKLIAEALDTHNEKKHGEAKDKDSAFKDEKIEKSRRMLGTITAGGETKEIQPAEQIKIKDAGAAAAKAKKDSVANDAKAKAEAAAKERRVGYKKEGLIKSENITFDENGQWKL